MSENLMIGNVVKLKSGSEPMTIQRIEDDEVLCAWFEGHTIQHETFAYNTLKEYVRPLESKWWTLAKGGAKAISSLSKELHISNKNENVISQDKLVGFI
ncbi:MAG: DUF2158 domain-containing protein [Pseudomonadota bacterium]